LAKADTGVGKKMSVVDKKKLGGRTLYWLYLRDEWVPCYIAREYRDTPDRAYINSCLTYGSGMSLEVSRKDLMTDVELFMQGINPEIEHEKQKESIRKKWNTMKKQNTNRICSSGQ
jgi:hypothetical protein